MLAGLLKACSSYCGPRPALRTAALENAHFGRSRQLSDAIMAIRVWYAACPLKRPDL